MYRFWRDLGYAAGAVVAGLLAGTFGLTTTVLAGGAAHLRLGAARRPVDQRDDKGGSR